jgi:hypothetical protein
MNSRVPGISSRVRFSEGDPTKIRSLFLILGIIERE